MAIDTIAMVQYVVVAIVTMAELACLECVDGRNIGGDDKDTQQKKKQPPRFRSRSESTILHTSTDTATAFALVDNGRRHAALSVRTAACCLRRVAKSVDDITTVAADRYDY